MTKPVRPPTKPPELNPAKKKRRPRTKPGHTITPTQAEFMWRLRCYHHEHADAGATADELASLMKTSKSMVRKLASKLSQPSPRYVDFDTFAEMRADGEGVEREVNVTRYFLTENQFAKWLRSGPFLLELLEFERDSDGLIEIEAYKRYMMKKHGYTEAMFKEDWDYFVPRGYLYHYDLRFKPARRIQSEKQWLKLLLQHYKPRAAPP